ncbi:MAG: polysaccharide deacetylase family protein [Candidatus Omnitrophota bacterium]
MRKLFVFLFITISAALFFVYAQKNYEVPILMYHSLDQERTDNYAAVEPAVFSNQMKSIDDWGYKVISLEDYCRMISNNQPVKRKTVVITFDDGYKDNLIALDSLNNYGFPATIFIVAGNIEKEGYLSSGDINMLYKSSRIRIGSHTFSHAYLPDTPTYKLKEEINYSKEILEEISSAPVLTLSYPSGGFDTSTVAEVKDAGYICACTTNRGFSRETNLYALRRIKISNNDKGIKFFAKISGFYNIFRTPKNPY